jgi:hypothetical protein
MATKEDEAAAALYVKLMEEVKYRAWGINMALDRPHEVPPPLVREFCYLQLRMMCELVALGCLVAHGDIANNKYFQKAYKADEILNQLDGLHPEFYPAPAVPTIIQMNELNPISGKPRQNIQLAPLTVPFLKKNELIALYRRCGDILHKGNLRKLLSQQDEPNAPTDLYSDIKIDGQKMLALLSNHTIMRIGRKFYFLVHLSVTALGGIVQVNIGETQ